MLARLVSTLIFIPLSLLSSHFAWAEPGVHFYRSPQSFFASGQVSRKHLENTKVRTEFEFSYLVQREQKVFWLTANELVRDLNLSKSVIHKQTKELYNVLKVDGFWIHGENEANGTKEWLNIKEAIPNPQDAGLGITLIATSLHEKPQWKSNSIIQIPAQTRVEVISYSSSWAEVLFKTAGTSLKGYIDLSNLILKADFASFVMTEDNLWRAVKHRELNELVLDHDEKIALDKVKAWRTRPLDAISLVSTKNTLLRGHLKIKKIEADHWNVSALKGHGEIYWKAQKSQSQLAEENNSETISTEELLKHEIQHVAFHPNNPLVGIVSAGGIYLTTDGQRWKKLTQFKDQNLPVSMGPKGEIVAGHQWSLDLGKSFRPFVKWERLAHLIEAESGRPPKQILLQGVQFLNSSKMKLSLDTGVSKLALLGNPNDSEIKSWQLQVPSGK